MGLFGKRSAPAVDPVEVSTHVLEWLPAWLIQGATEGTWDLQTRENFDAGTPEGAYDVPGFPVDVAPETLAGWAQENLGYPVVLTPGYQDLQEGRDEERCPLYWVTPAED